MCLQEQTFHSHCPPCYASPNNSNPVMDWTVWLWVCARVCVCTVHTASWHYNQCNVVWSWKADLLNLSWIWNNWLYPMKPYETHTHTHVRTYTLAYGHLSIHEHMFMHTHTHIHRCVRGRKCKLNNWGKQHCCCYYCSLGGCQSMSSFTVCASACVRWLRSTGDCRIANLVTSHHTRPPVRPWQK